MECLLCCVNEGAWVNTAHGASRAFSTARQCCSFSLILHPAMGIDGKNKWASSLLGTPSDFSAE